MKANELMIGDWVLIYGNPTKIDNLCVINEITEPTLITRSYIRIDVENPDTGVYNDHLVIQSEIALKKVHPIPLTGEILEKNGFCIVASGDFQKDNGEDICRCWTYERDNVDITISHSYALIRLKDKHHYINEPTSIVINCYIHELQHALRLCGINKDIQL